jgi:hypothetical protein
MRSVYWTAERLDQLQELVNEGASVARAAVVLRRSMFSVRQKAREIGSPFPTQRALRERAFAKGTGA